MRCFQSETTRIDKFFLTQDTTHATVQRIQFIDQESVYKTPCTNNPGFIKYKTLICTKNVYEVISPKC